MQKRSKCKNAEGKDFMLWDPIYLNREGDKLGYWLPGIERRKERNDLLLDSYDVFLREDRRTLELVVVIAFGFAEFIKNH